MTLSQPVRRAARGVVVCTGAAAILCGVVRAQVGAGAGAVPAQQQQQLIGYVKADDADVTGATDVMDGQAVLSGSVGVTAKSHTAVITLGRGGLARVCQTSSLHMTQSRETTAGSKSGGAAVASDVDGSGTAPLLFSLDRGAVEIRMNGLASDSIMTPDLRMTVQTNGPLDVRLRVAGNGDTCVENRGSVAPALAVSDPFGTSMYELMAGQHVLFEHGDMHEVVDHETEPCGCPDEQGATVADALLAPSGQKLGPKTATQPTAAALHPFPAAVSEGLTTAPAQTEANPAGPQATTELRYNAAADAVPAGVNSAAPPVVAAIPSSAAPASLGSVQPVQEPGSAKPANAKQPPSHDLVHAIGHFFRYLFGH